MTSAPNITAYDIRLSVRDAGEVTTAQGWVEVDGTRHELRVEADVSSRGATYFLDGEPRWWSEVEWLDSWFENRWQEAAAKHWNEELGEPENFVEHMTSKEDHDA